MIKRRHLCFWIPLLILLLAGCRSAENEGTQTIRFIDLLRAENISLSPFLQTGAEQPSRPRIPATAYALRVADPADNPLELKTKLGYRGGMYEVILAPPRSEYTFEVTIPRDAFLEFGAGIIRDQNFRKAPSESPLEVRFSIRMEARGRKKTLFSKSIPVPAKGTTAKMSLSMEKLDLAPAGLPVKLIFSTSGEPGAFSFWFNPVVFRKKTDTRNVILISLDALRSDHLGCYGYGRPTSPRIDALAEDGVLFEKSYTTSNWTLPSHTALFTSLFGVSHGVYWGQHRIPPSAVMLAEVLRKNGFFCQAVTGGGLVSPFYGFWRGFDLYRSAEGGLAKENSAELVFRAAAAWLEKNTDKDTFLFLHTYQVHAPYDSPPPFDSMFTPENSRLSTFSFDDLGGRSGSFKPLPEADRRNIIGLYDGEIRYTDDALIGPLIAKLKALGLYDRTMIILLSDHGEEFLERGAWQHGQNLYEETLRVPLIIKFPRSRFHGKKITGVCRLIDVMPTILEEMKIEPFPQELDGASLLPLITGKEKAGRFFLADTSYPSLNLGDPKRIPPPGDLEPDIIAFGDADTKLILNRRISPEYALEYSPPRPDRPEVELYDLRSDPAEKVNLATDRPEVVREMLRHIQELYGKPSRRRGSRVEIDPQLREELRALGYIH